MMSHVANRKVRVVVADDSAVMRKIIATALERHPEIEVVYVAVNGLQAVDAVSEFKPDVVTLDVEMPEMDGISAVKAIRKIDPKLPLIMFSSLTQQGTPMTTTALTAGATDYVGKPAISAGSVGVFKVLDEQLVPKVVGFGRRHQARVALGAVAGKASGIPADSATQSIADPTSSSVAPANMSDVRSLGTDRPGKKVLAAPARAVCIGVSTGGPMALMQIFSQFKMPLPVPVFIVQHMPSSFTTSLAARLTASGVMKVVEPHEGEVAVAGVAYLAPGGLHMVLSKKGTRTHIHLTEDAPENSCRPAADVLFRSAADVYGKDLLAVVLTGMGYDGMRGCQVVRAKHGQVLAQDEETSVIWGMPGAVVKNNLADLVLPIDKIADEIVFRTRKIPATGRSV
jgi:two-component system chemotaxis response regulator CheB